MATHRTEAQRDAAQEQRSDTAQAANSGPAAAAPVGTLLARSGRGLGPVQGRAAARLQRSVGNRATGRVLAREWAIAPTVEDPPEVTLAAAKAAGARNLNRVMFRDAAEIGVIRDVLGIPRDPCVVDEDFVNAVVRYQGSYGLTADGILGPVTAGRLAAEITAESNFLAQPATGGELRRTARRLHLRSLTSRRQGRLVHQGFIGANDNPEGCVTVRLDDGGDISLEYTGENSDAVHWVQFINMRLTGTAAGGAAPVFQTGSVGTTGGPVTWSNAGTTNWFVDAIPGADPQYDTSGGASTRTAGVRNAMFDRPGGASGLPVAQAFAAAGGTGAGATTVTMPMAFASYVVRANRARYRVDWVATTTYDITAGTSSAINYTGGSGRAVTGLAAEHRTALLAEYAGSPIN